MSRLPQRDLILIPVVGFLAAAVLLTALGLLAKSHYFDEFDTWFRAFAQAHQSPWLTRLFLTVTVFGSTWVLIGLGTVLVLILCFKRKWQTVRFFLITMAGQIILDQSFKAIFQRERPEALIEYVKPFGYSFPSGHALASISFYGILAWLITRSGHSRFLTASVWITCVTFALLIGTSRVYIGIHNASDVLGGFLAGAVWTASMIIADSCARADRVDPPPAPMSKS